MRKYHSPLQIFGAVLFIISAVAFIVSMIICYIGLLSGTVSLFISLILLFIGYKAYIKGKIQTEAHYGNDNQNRHEDENIYKDTLKKD